MKQSMVIIINNSLRKQHQVRRTFKKLMKRFDGFKKRQMSAYKAVELRMGERSLKREYIFLAVAKGS